MEIVDDLENEAEALGHDLVGRHDWWNYADQLVARGGAGGVNGRPDRLIDPPWRRAIRPANTSRRPAIRGSFSGWWCRRNLRFAICDLRFPQSKIKNRK